MKITKVRRLIALALVLAIGMIVPSNDVKMKAETVEVEATAKAYPCNAFNDYISQLNVGNVEVASIRITEPAQPNNLDKTHVLSFTMPEDGLACFNFYAKNYAEYNFSGDMYVYSDVNRTNEVFNTYYNSMNTSGKKFINLKAGTYYVEVMTSRLFSYHEMDHELGFSVGYRKAGSKVVTLTPSTTRYTNKSVAVKVTPNKDVETIWYEKREPVLLGNQFYWTNDKILDASYFRATSNGIYTVQVKDCFGNYYQESITIRNIDRVKPNRPTLWYYKSGKTYIRGKAEKNSLVYVKIGKRYYKSYATRYGNFIIKTPKLKKGYPIYVCCFDAAKNKSYWKGYRVK